MKTTESSVYFDRKKVVPDDPKLKKVLGVVYPAYKEILLSIDTYPQTWKFYGPGHGWQLKVTRKGKALFYLTPLVKSFRLALAVRESEKEILLNSKLPAKTKKELMTAKKFSEGYPLRFLVGKQSEMRAVHMVVAALKDLRS